MRVLIADDEPIARDILTTYVSKMPMLELVGECQNAVEVFAALNKKPVDLLLLDINMPEITGVDMLRTLRNPPMVIFTTAYSDYAVESYDLNAVDYLLKPISFERFVAAINKAIDLQDKEQTTTTIGTPVDNNLFVKSDGKLVKVNLDELILIEGVKDYVKLRTFNNDLLVHSTMKNMEEQLAAYKDFVRVHKSHIVNIKHINEVEGNMLKLHTYTVVVGNTYKETLDDILTRYRLI